MSKTRSPTQLRGVTSLLAGSPWAIRERDHRELVAVFNRYLSADVSEDTLTRLRAEREARAALQGEQQQQAQGVALIGVYGTIVPRGSLMVEYCGATDPHTLADRVTEAASDPGIHSIVLDIMSGGGAVTGIRVAEEAIRRARDVKPVIAVANSIMCSAALWIGAQASELVAAPGAEIGSIGCIGTHVDEQGALDREGLKVTYVRSNPGKALGQSAESMDGDVLSQWQDEINRVQADFEEALVLGRRLPLADVQALANGHVWFGQEAVNVGLADRVATLGDVLREQTAAAAKGTVKTARRIENTKVMEARSTLTRIEQDVLTSNLDAPGRITAEQDCRALKADLQAALLFADDPAPLDHLITLADRVMTRLTAAARPTTPPTPPEDTPVKVTLKDRTGASRDFDTDNPTELQAFLDDQHAQGVAQGRQQEKEASAALLGLEPKDATAERLSALKAQASDGEAYRQSLLNEVEALALTITGDEKKAASIRAANSVLSIDLLKDTVAGMGAQRDAMVPAGRQSQEPPEEDARPQTKRPKPKTW